MYENSLDGQAHACGGTFRLASEAGTFRIHGVDVPVEQRFYRCNGCGEEHVTEDLARAVQEEAASAFRKSERFLSGAEIRALRERLGLSQEQFEAALGLGAKSLARWENDRVLQNRSMDNLLRAVDRDPGLVAYLADLHGADLPEGALPSRSSPVVDSARWPRSLVAKLEAMAFAEGSDLDHYLQWLLTEYSIAGSFTAHMSRRLEDRVADFEQVLANQRTGEISYGLVEPWLQEQDDVMRDAAKADSHGG
jgi:putative zinc finger/helix-turn-helix YgiT family protein